MGHRHARRLQDILAFDEAPVLITERIAFDRAGTARRLDQDGRLHIAVTNISKANVCPYKGSEIPYWQALGLDRDRIYKMLRPPEELARPETVQSANNIQLMAIHTKVTALSPKEDKVAGSTGTDAEFVHPYLRNSLVVWRQEDIDDIESKDRCELSCAYHYEPEMTSGTYEGEAFDGRMRNILFNHVAQVEEGRVGPDVVVADSKESLMNIRALATRTTSMNALAGFILPRLAKGAKVDLAMAFDGIPVGPGFDSKLLAKRLGPQIKGKLAEDGSMKQVADLLDAIGENESKSVEKDESVSKEQHGAMEAAAHGQSNLGIPEKVGAEFAEADKGKRFGDKARDWLKGKGMSDDDITELEGMEEAEDEEEEPDKDEPGVENEPLDGKDDPPPFKGMPKPGGGKDKAARDKEAKDKAAKDKAAKDAAEAEKEKEGMVTKGAMDAALAAARKQTLAEVTKTQRDIRGAEREVRPIVGELDVVFDSAADVYKAALKARNVDIEGVPPEAYRALVKMLPKASATPRDREKVVAMDSAGKGDFDKMFPGAANIRVTA